MDLVMQKNIEINTQDIGTIAVLLGGTSAEREISLNSGAAVCQALERQGISYVTIDPAQLDYVEQLLRGNFTCAFIALHGRGGEDGSIQGVLEHLQIPYTGSGILASSLAMDKVRTKQLCATFGIPVSKQFIWQDHSTIVQVAAEIGDVPMAVKPSFEGSSIGVSRIDGLNNLASACSDAANYGPVMIEPWIDGLEITVGILGDQALPSINIVTQEGFYDYYAKYKAGTTNYICPAKISSEDELIVRELAVNAFKALGASGWGRADFIQDKAGKFWFLELNTVPGLTEHSLVPMAAKRAGINFDDLILNIIDHALRKRQAPTKEEQAQCASYQQLPV